MKRNPELKIKIKSLAEEAKIIRKDEGIAYDNNDYALGNSLHYHRVVIVRREARATLLAYQYLRGKSYESCEGIGKTTPKWDNVKRMVKKYGGASFDHHAWVKGVNYKPLDLPTEPEAAA
jgi:hypothetical protein